MEYSEKLPTNNCSTTGSTSGHGLSVQTSLTYTIQSLPFVTKCACEPQLESGLQPRHSMNDTHVSSSVVRRHFPGRGIRRTDAASQVSPWAVELECSLAADTRRIFDALTVPEFIEAWICVPGSHHDCQNVTCRVAHGFQIEHRCYSGATTTITGTYFSFLKRKLSFSWRPAGVPGMADSFVDIRLVGDFEKSILRLRHSGFTSEAEFKWHNALWAASITRLTRLFHLPTNRADQHRSAVRGRRPEILFEL